jgi:hypothetical protein
VIKAKKQIQNNQNKNKNKNKTMGHKIRLTPPRGVSWIASQSASKPTSAVTKFFKLIHYCVVFIT